MKIEINNLQKWQHDETSHELLIKYQHGPTIFSDWAALSLNEIENLETNLTNIIKQLQDYRISQNHD